MSAMLLSALRIPPFRRLSLFSSLLIRPFSTRFLLSSALAAAWLLH